MKIRMRALVAWLSIGGASSLGMLACGASPQALCDMKCECEQCSPGRYDECLADADADAREADFRDCGGFYDDLVACQDATGFCSGFEWETSCGPEKDRFKRCMEGK
jgi:hypothetical protein